jgi:hypothetical protein
VSRLRTLRSGSARVAALAAAIRAAADNQDIAVVRFQQKWTRHDRPYRELVAWTAGFRAVPLDQDAQDAIDHLMRSGRPDINWFINHDYHLDTGMLRRSPYAEDDGYIPDEDGTFGGSDPAFAPRAADEIRRAAA